MHYRFDGKGREAFCFEFRLYFFGANFIEFIDCNSDGVHLILASASFGESAQYFAVIDTNLNWDFEFIEYTGVKFNQFDFVEGRLTTNNIGIALIEFAVTASLWTVGTPHGLYLVAFERKGELTVIHGHIAGEWDGEVVFKGAFGECFFAFALKDVVEIGTGLFVFFGAFETVVENFEHEFIAFFAIFTNEGVEVFHGRRFEGLKPEVFHFAPNYGKNVMAFLHNQG